MKLVFVSKSNVRMHRLSVSWASNQQDYSPLLSSKILSIPPSLSLSLSSLPAHSRSDRISSASLQSIPSAINEVSYQNDRVVITTNVVWTPDERFYVFFDLGALFETRMCSRGSMLIPVSGHSIYPTSLLSQRPVIELDSDQTTYILCLICL